MLTRLTIRNFKRFSEVEVELGNPVLLIGPNNSGKRSALQALALWDVGLKRWLEKRRGKTPGRRPGVTINRRDLIAVPVPDANLLWRQLHVRDVQRRPGTEKIEQETKNIRVDIVVAGVPHGQEWKCGLEFDYANEESFYCRPLRLSEEKNPARMEIPEEAKDIKLAFLPPMSGLAATETRLDPGAVNVRIGEGRTAEVLRNLCYGVEPEAGWARLSGDIRHLFGVELERPQYIAERGEIVMRYRENGIGLDLSASGRGLQQTLLLLAYLYGNPRSVLLLDEPDAHLEILRQQQIYQLLADLARENGNQIIAASHSEVLLNEAAGRDVAVAFVGRPHRVDDKGSQARKALAEIGFQHYYEAEQTGWVLYLEGSTDLAHLRSFAGILGHAEAQAALERPFVHYVANSAMEVVKHYYGLREAVPRLKAIAIFDRLERSLPDELRGIAHTWRRREIESYVCTPGALERYARSGPDLDSPGPLFEHSRVEAMEASIAEISDALQKLGKGSPWGPDIKVSDDFLEPLFGTYYRKLGLPNLMAKKHFHELARYVTAGELDPEAREKLDLIAAVARSARAVQG